MYTRFLSINKGFEILWRLFKVLCLKDWLVIFDEYNRFVCLMLVCDLDRKTYPQNGKNENNNKLDHIVFRHTQTNFKWNEKEEKGRDGIKKIERWKYFHYYFVTHYAYIQGVIYTYRSSSLKSWLILRSCDKYVPRMNS